LKATVFVVLHLSPHSRSQLAHILGRAGNLPASVPEDGEKWEQGRIYVAPPNFHLLLDKQNTVLVKNGPKENRFRPSIDALFRSAAYNYGPRVIGIVLSGLLNDGTSGLWAIQQLGGLTIIQDPAEAEFPQMPANALEYVDVDHVLSLERIGALLQKLCAEKAPGKPNVSRNLQELLEMEVVIAREDNAFEMGIMNKGSFTPFTCPECHGALVKLIEGDIIRFRCHTGHGFSASSLLAGISESIEETLWQSMRALEESTMLLKEIGQHFTEMGKKEAGSLFQKKAQLSGDQARRIHESLFELEQLSEDIRPLEGDPSLAPFKSKRKAKE
ncbi:MAG TPA: chemotaxis protein CheB, partial [Chitinophagaceae bacterium]|nr:chemotaxis protein CheB [Chitinophagaceae bacterium]